MFNMTAPENDAELFELLGKAKDLRQDTLNLIASENIASDGVRLALSSALLDKYAEGYPGKRYYPGNTVSDEVELLAIKRAKETFGLGDGWAANVQPYSGSPANFAVYNALLEPGDKFLAMSLASGGHLTHGHKASATGRFFSPIHYSVNPDTGLIDYEDVRRIAVSSHPKIIVSGYTAYPRAVNFQRIGEIAKEVGAIHFADISHIAGLIAADLHPSPFPYADVVTTTTHKTLRGPRGAVIFMKSELADAINKSVFPGLQGGPHLNVIAAKAHAFYLATTPEFKEYQRQVIKNAAVMANFLEERRNNVLTGGTDTHLFLLNTTAYDLDGMSAERLLEECGIIANRNSLPRDISAFRPSGLRMGTPALTSRGFTEEASLRLADLIDRVLVKMTSVADAQKEVLALARQFPIAE